MVYDQYIVMTLSTLDQTESWMINVTMSPRQYIPLSAHKHYDLRQAILYIYLSTNIKLMITWPYISRYTSTLKVSWCHCHCFGPYALLSLSFILHLTLSGRGHCHPLLSLGLNNNLQVLGHVTFTWSHVTCCITCYILALPAQQEEKTR